MLENKCRLALIIVEFDTPEDTIRCLDTVEKYLGDRAKVYIYDNSRQYHTLLTTHLTSHSISYEHVRNNGNLGFAKACNLGLDQAKRDGFEYAMLLNSDTLLVDNSPLLAFDIFENNKNIAVLGVVNYFTDNPSKIWQAGMKLRKSYLGFKPVAPIAGNDITLCDYVAGSSFILRLAVLDDIGFLNEDYFAYYEEIDYCFRVKASGMQVAYMNYSKILHKVGSSSSSAVKTYLKSRNKLYFYRSILRSELQFVVVAGLLLIKDFLIIIAGIGSLKNLQYMWLGIKDFRSRRMKMPRFMRTR
jgi:GT2 family glycosyltransferase